MMNEEIIMSEDEVIPTADNATDTQGEPCFAEEAPLDPPQEEQKSENGEKESVELLKNELDALRTELEEKKKVFERMSREIGEFSEIFPEKSVNSIPDSVWESVKAGIPLAAAYALYERKNAVRADAASRINERNGEKATGSIGRCGTENFYTPDEVRAMSRSEVKRNYSKIIESMKKWN